jgi:signal transduction histidine kinase
MTYENEKILKAKDHLKIIMNKSLSDENCTILSDDIRLRQILYNLLGNALKFTNNGFIKFEYVVVDDKLRFMVQDSGKGIAKDNQSIIFERFRQEEDSYTRFFGGSGLGLSISKGLVELLGGEIWLESDEGVGSTFFFTINYNCFD